MIINVAPQASIATTPSPSPSVANEGFAPLCGAAAISMAALKAPVAPEEGTTGRQPAVGTATQPAKQINNYQLSTINYQL